MFTLIFAFLTVILLIKLNEILGMAIGFRKEHECAAADSQPEAAHKVYSENLHKEIFKYCRDFDERDFLDKVQRVFKVVFKAYASGDLTILKDLLTPKLYTAFEMAIKDRTSKGEVLSGNIERIVSASIDSTNIDNNKVFINVMFISEQVTVLRNKEGAVIEGNDDFVNSVREVWTFLKSIDSNGKQWYLSEISYVSGDESA